MYEVPAPDELKAFMQENNLTGADVAAFAGVNSRSARRWIQPPEHKGAAPIPWAAWAIIQILTGKKLKKDFLKLIDEWKKEKTGRGLHELGVGGKPCHKEKDDE